MTGIVYDFNKYLKTILKKLKNSLENNFESQNINLENIFFKTLEKINLKKFEFENYIKRYFLFFYFIVCWNNYLFYISPKQVKNGFELLNKEDICENT